jgi:chromosome partitioning protein
MPVISFASSKGGAGKTTSAIILGTELAAQGAAVAFIDADPAGRLVRWSQKAQLRDRISVTASSGEELIQDEIDIAQRKATFVLLDLEGSASRLVSFAIAESDLVIVPTGEEQQDVEDAVATLKEVARAGRAARRDIPTAVLFCRTNPAKKLKNRLERQLHNDLAAATRCFETELHRRAAFSSLHNAGGGLRDLDPLDTSGVDKALENASEWAFEVVELLKEGRVHAKAS